MKALILSLITFTSVPLFAADKPVPKIIEVTVTGTGFEPSSINVKKGETVTLKVTRKTDATCATQIQVPSLKIKKDLPLNQAVTIELGKVALGEIRFGCGMNMMLGAVVRVE